MFLNAFGHCKVDTLQKMYFHNYKIIEKDVITDLSAIKAGEVLKTNEHGVYFADSSQYQWIPQGVSVVSRTVDALR